MEFAGSIGPSASADPQSLHPDTVSRVTDVRDIRERTKTMRKTFAMTALAALIAAPLMMAPTEASASCQSRKTTGTLLGGLGGALVGNSVSHGGGGAVIGGLGGAVVGHEIGKAGCNRRTVYYRDRGYRSGSSSRARYADAPYREPARKVYYDQYGNPVASEPAYR
jgi:hypothetical protein